MRVFLDTNVLISAFLGSGLCCELLRTVSDEHELCVSRLVIDEYQRVLRSKFGAGRAELNEALMFVQQAEVLHDFSAGIPREISTTNDAVNLATASAARVDLLVTGDQGMRDRASDLDVVAVSPRGFFQLTTQADDAYPLSPDDDEPIVSESRENPVREKSFNFALEIVRLYKNLQDQKEYVLSKQILRSGTSIGANVEEATAAESRRDFVHKLSIASKEARETNYWLRLLMQSGLIESSQFTPLLEESTELVKMLTAIVKTSTRKSMR